MTRRSGHSGQRRLDVIPLKQAWSGGFFRAIDVRLRHADAPRLSELITNKTSGLHGILHNAEQLSAFQRWGQIAAKILQGNSPVFVPEPPLAPAPS